jgi:hypothetical protein
MIAEFQNEAERVEISNSASQYRSAFDHSARST